MRATRAEIDLGAIEHNVKALSDHVGDAAICAVVKADGYGHGALPVARSAVNAGATWLAVALVEEGVELRDGGFEEPILLLSESEPEQMHQVVEYRLRPTVYSEAGITAAAAAATRGEVDLPVHLKVDTGMGRVGVQPSDALKLAKAIGAEQRLVLEGVYTHCAVADEPENSHTDLQLERFKAVLLELEAAGITPPIVHTANSALAITRPESCYDMVRLGIAIYGIAPSPALDGMVDLIPAMSLHSAVSLSKKVAAGQRLSYGLRYETAGVETIVTIPIGYADGYRRRLFAVGGEVLIDGERRPLAGTVTMDQILVSCGDDDIAVGSPVVLVGIQGSETITMSELGDRLDTIAYEMCCSIGPRVRREYR